MSRLVASCLVFVLIDFYPLNSYAYIDPNAGGFIFQWLFPLLIAVAGAWKIFRQRINALFSRLFRRRK